MDMDGVLVHEEAAIPGAAEFLAALRERGIPFLVLTNNSIYTRARPRRAAAHERPGGPGDVDLDLRPGHRAASSRTSGRAARRS